MSAYRIIDKEPEKLEWAKIRSWFKHKFPLLNTQFTHFRSGTPASIN